MVGGPAFALAFSSINVKLGGGWYCDKYTAPGYVSAVLGLVNIALVVFMFKEAPKSRMLQGDVLFVCVTPCSHGWRTKPTRGHNGSGAGDAGAELFQPARGADGTIPLPIHVEGQHPRPDITIVERNGSANIHDDRRHARSGGVWCCNGVQTVGARCL